MIEGDSQLLVAEKFLSALLFPDTLDELYPVLVMLSWGEVHFLSVNNE